MGYRRHRQVVSLVWPEGDELHGLKIEAKAIPVGMYLKFTTVFGQPGSSDNEDEVRAIYASFADSLVSWNLEDEDGESVPATLEGLFTQELDFINRLVWAWAQSLTTVPEDLGKESPSGETSPEASLPMEPLSPNLESLSAPV